MKRLNELQSLVKMAQSFGQDPDPKILAEIVYLEEQEAKKTNQQKKLKQRVRAAGRALFESAPKPVAEPVIVEQPQIIPEPVKQQTLMDRVVKNIAESTVVNPEPALVPKPADPLAKKVELLEKWISRIAATGPGGGAAQIYNLDIPVKTVTGDYTIGRRDYYIGVSSTVKTYITLPALGSNQKEGRIVVIKDESGRAQLTPIAIVGTIDNDPNGAEIRINNGAIQLVYRSGWRII